MARYYVGLDVHSRQSTYVVESATGRVVGTGAVPTTTAGLTKLRDQYRLPPDTAVALESGPIAFFVARELRRLGLTPRVIDAFEVRRKAYRPNQKSDRRDARELCEGLRRNQYRGIVYVPSPAHEALRALIARRRHFVRLQTIEINAAKAAVRAAGLTPLLRGVLNSEAAWTKLAARLQQHPEVRLALEHHHALWRCAGERVAAIEEALQRATQPFRAALTRLQTVPGVGPIVAATVVAALADVTRFPDAKRAASYAGLVPTTYQSADSDRHGRITKRGPAELRAMLCEAAQHARRPGHPLHAFFVRLCVRRGYKMAVTATAHRLCRILFAMLRDERRFDPAQVRHASAASATPPPRRYVLRPRGTKPAA
jgi:transposase